MIVFRRALELNSALVSKFTKICENNKSIHRNFKFSVAFVHQLPCRCKMDAFLSTTLEKLKSNNYAALYIVLGNESCDLDSAVSALVYAAFLHWQYMQIKCKVCTRAHRDESLYKDDIFLPILNVDREDYNLKTEVAFCFREHDIPEDKLIFRNDYDLQQLVTTKKTNVVLVDHHVLSVRDHFLGPFVSEIIDHRIIDHANWRYKDDTRSTMEIVGSCCTLVAQRIRDLSALVARDEDFFNSYPVATDLLHCAIILDTVNFSKEVNKATPHDEEVVLFLENIMKPNNYHEHERKCKLERLVSARKDVSSLSPEQLLKKDVKKVGDVLVPSFPILVEEFLQKSGALLAVTEALGRQDCSLAVLLGMCLEAGLRRDVALYSPLNPKIAVQFAQFLKDWSNPGLLLTPGSLNKTLEDSGCIHMKQGNLSVSRKQYMPVVTQFLSIYKKE